MQCPACNRSLAPLMAGSLTVDGCTGGCGGIWLDHGELERLDEGSEPCPPEVMRLLANAKVPVDRAKVRSCPTCTGTNLEKTFFQESYNVEIDVCPGCSGVFLDLGELPLVREMNDAHASRRSVIESFNSKAAKITNPQMKKRISAVLELLFK